MTEPRTALVVDDEDQLLRLIARVVERGGDQVLTAATGDEARAIFREHAAEIQIVLLDVMMPDGDGAATLLPEFLETRPDLEVILTSGDALPSNLATELGRIGGQFLPKPFVPQALLRMFQAPESGASPRGPVAPAGSGVV
jgi:CheY-like chemotaxis protein